MGTFNEYKVNDDVQKYNYVEYVNVDDLKIEDIKIPINNVIDNTSEVSNTDTVEVKDVINNNTSSNIKTEVSKPSYSVKEDVQITKPVTEVENSTDVVSSDVPIIQEEKTYISVKRSTGIIQIELEEYVIGVVGSEMPASFNSEALKAQSVIARTYALKKTKAGLTLTDTVKDQVYKDVSELKKLWGKDFDKYYAKVKNAVESTSGEYLTYNNEYIEAVYHSTSNGYTEDSVNVWNNSFPYLKSVVSDWDKSASSYLRETSYDTLNILNVLNIEISDMTSIEVLSRTSSGRIDQIKIDDKVYFGIELRSLLGLRSTDFDIRIESGKVVFTTRGYGHGVGLSQYGANGMANAGYNYVSILSHYYNGTDIQK